MAQLQTLKEIMTKTYSLGDGGFAKILIKQLQDEFEPEFLKLEVMRSLYRKLKKCEKIKDHTKNAKMLFDIYKDAIPDLQEWHEQLAFLETWFKTNQQYIENWLKDSDDEQDEYDKKLNVEFALCDKCRDDFMDLLLDIKALLKSQKVKDLFTERYWRHRMIISEELYGGEDKEEYAITDKWKTNVTDFYSKLQKKIKSVKMFCSKGMDKRMGEDFVRDFKRFIATLSKELPLIKAQSFKDLKSGMENLCKDIQKLSEQFMLVSKSEYDFRSIFADLSKYCDALLETKGLNTKQLTYNGIELV